MSTTPNYGFDLFANGETGWGTSASANFSLIEAEIAKSRIPHNSPSVGATTTLDLSLARAFKFTVSQATTLSITNVPANTFHVRLFVLVTNGSAFVLTYPGSVVHVGGVAPTLQSSGVDLLLWETWDAGTTWYVRHAGKNLSLTGTISTTGNISATTGRVTSNVGMAAAHYSDVVVDAGTGAVTTEVDLGTVIVTGNLMGVRGTLHIIAFITLTGTANTKTLRLKFGGTTFVTKAYAAGTTGSKMLEFWIANRALANSQIANGHLTGDTSAHEMAGQSTAAIDTTTSQNVVVTGQTANAADELTLNHLAVEILPAS